MQAGHVTLVGAGPGDPALLTLGAVAALASAEAVLYDALVSPAILAYADREAELIAVGKRAGAHSMAQPDINALLITKALEGKRVVRLKGGDPFVFGRGGEEALACREAGVSFSVVPGVTSAVSVPAYAGIPVTHRGLASNFAVITGSEAGDATLDWGALAKIDTLVVLMGASALPEVARNLIAAGRDASTPAASISEGTLPAQRSVTATLETIAAAVTEAALPTPLITVIGKVASLADGLAWRESLPLAGKSVVVTRTRAQASDLRRMLEGLGASVIEAPVLDIQHDTAELVTDERVGSRWDWIVFASQNGVEAFFAGLRAAGRDARSLGTSQVAAVGEATATTLAAHGVVADFVPSRATGECLAAELPRVGGARVLVAQGNLGDGRLSGALRARGAHIEEVTLYRTMPAPLDDVMLGAVLAADAITFASASSARFLREALGERQLAPGTKLCAIGEHSSAATKDAFGRVDITASDPSIASLVEAVREALA
jgi:uroporphyrinogen III methyltransferase/synthase